MVIHCRPSMEKVPVSKGIKTYFLAVKYSLWNLDLSRILNRI